MAFKVKDVLLLWFRNDLRLHDNPAFYYALQQRKLSNKDVKAVFFVSQKQWLEHGLAPIKIDFMLRHVRAIERELKHYHITLDVVEMSDFNQQANYLIEQYQQQGFSELVFNTEPELNETRRDNQLSAAGLNITQFEADVILPKGTILNGQQQMYKVFTPFKKAWLHHIKQHGFDYINKQTLVPYQIEKFDKTILDKTNKSQASLSSAWPLAKIVEQQVIPQFLSDKVLDYSEYRDIPSIKGTSGLSPYLAIGAISPRYLLTLLLNKFPDLLSGEPQGAAVWLSELIWREFYRHLLFHFPALCQHKNFNNKFDNLYWPNSENHFLAWQQGKTGYPIVDAAMRQLDQTGWMHNRLRMIVASFLTKHLLVDWRLGEQYFMSKLVDGDFAANNGGWQWSAGTGCDAQPYFRIFNPITQSEKFDPDGSFIRKYLPELANVPTKDIHFPHEYLKRHKISDYWPAIVDHKQARQNALLFYKGTMN